MWLLPRYLTRGWRVLTGWTLNMILALLPYMWVEGFHCPVTLYVGGGIPLAEHSMWLLCCYFICGWRVSADWPLNVILALLPYTWVEGFHRLNTQCDSCAVTLYVGGGFPLAAHSITNDWARPANTTLDDTSVNLGPTCQVLGSDESLPYAENNPKYNPLFKYCHGIACW